MKYLVVLTLIYGSLYSNILAQNSNTKNVEVSKIFENPDPNVELADLKAKKINLENRLIQLNQAQIKDTLEIQRVEGLIKYFSHKIESLENYIQSVEYAEKHKMPQQGTMSDSTYHEKLYQWKLEMKDSTDKLGDEGIKTTLTRDEFNRLPLERQNRILSMPERYTILD